ncbi:MAG: hypothetical protein WKF84_03105 [Pyrinomonadaceae bacterium]
MSIVHLIETLGSGGAERLLYTNLKHLPSARFRSTVMTIFDGPDRWASPIRQLGVKVESLGCRGYRGLAPGVSSLRSWLRKETPHLLHTHLLGGERGRSLGGASRRRACD